MASLMPPGKQQYFNPTTGRPLVGGQLFTYAAGTSTPKTTWQDAAGTIPNTNPITLDSTGSALVYWDGSYKIVLKDALGNTIYTVDGYTDVLSTLKRSSGSSLIGFIQSVAGAVARTVLDKLLDLEVSVKDFGVAGDGSNETAKFNAAITAAAADGRVLNLRGLTIVHDGSFSSSTAGAKFIWRNGKLKFSAGAKTSPMFQFTGVDTVDIQGVKVDGNRANVSGNNAGIFVVDGAQSVVFVNITMNDVYRYGISIGPTTGCQNVKVGQIRATDFGMQTGGTNVSLGEAVMVQNSENVEIDGFYYTNPSGTGDGQVLKAFYCGNVTVKNIYIDSASPSKVYPSASFVYNQNVEYNNITISGLCQVALENNSNLNQTYRDINTVGTPKALIQGTDGGVHAARLSENTTIDNWTDTSTAVDPLLTFNIIGAKGLRLHNVTTPGTINISRDDPSTDRRSEDIELERVSCGALNTLLVNGQKVVRDFTATGKWSNSSAGVIRAVDTTFATYSNFGLPGVWLVREFSGSDVFQIAGTIAADGGTFVWTAPTYINNTSAFSGEVLANNYLAASGANQFSQIKFNFYDYGTPTVAKTVTIDGAIPRNKTTLNVSRGARTLTFTNAEVDHVALNIEARVAFVNSGAPGQTAIGSAVL